jgi:hypothetical protein
MTKTTDPYSLGQLARGLAAVAARLEPGEAAGHCAQAARALTQAMTKTTDPGALEQLAPGLAAVAARLEPGEAARALTRAMTKTTHPGALDQLAPGLAAALTADAHDLPIRAAGLVGGVRAINAQPLLGLAVLAPALEPLPCRFSTPELVELLKHPLFVDRARRVVLDQLGTRYGRTFADPWEFVRFAQEQNLGLDFTTPPRRPESPAPLPAPGPQQGEGASVAVKGLSLKSSERPTEPEKMKDNPFGKGGRMKKLQPKY